MIAACNITIVWRCPAGSPEPAVDFQRSHVEELLLSGDRYSNPALTLMVLGFPSLAIGWSPKGSGFRVHLLPSLPRAGHFGPSGNLGVHRHDLGYHIRAVEPVVAKLAHWFGKHLRKQDP